MLPGCKLQISPSALTSAAAVQDMPETVLDNAAIMAEFMTVPKFHVRVLLSALSDAQGPKGKTRYEYFHKEWAPSNPSTSFHRYPRCSSISTPTLVTISILIQVPQCLVLFLEQFYFFWLLPNFLNR